MGKMLVGAVVGVFVGAMVFEIIHRKHPNLLESVEDKASRTARRAIDAFGEGYKRPKKVKAAPVEAVPADS